MCVCVIRSEGNEETGGGDVCMEGQRQTLEIDMQRERC